MYKNKKGCPLGATPLCSLALTEQRQTNNTDQGLEQRQTNNTNLGIRCAHPIQNLRLTVCVGRMDIISDTFHEA